MNIQIFKTAQEAAIETAQSILKLIKAKPNACIAFPTGRTMDAVYYQLTILSLTQKADFSKVKAFMVDEFLDIPFHHSQSYFSYLKEKLFLGLNFSEENIFKMNPGQKNLDIYSREYEQLIADHGGFDLVLLGLGMNGHIALNEPGSAHDSKTRVVAISGSTLEGIKNSFQNENEVPRRALTLGIQTIMKSREVFLIVTGTSKADILRKIIKEPASSDYPASLIRENNNLKIILDKDSSSNL
jgi:glucosamine-6-phosphate deaminase